jgi:hypothetical protein
MENLKVKDWVNYQGVKHQVAIVNGDGTVRLKSDDTSHPNYDNGTIGCFSESMFSEQKTAVEWLVEQLIQECGLDNEGDMAKYIINQALEMENKKLNEAYQQGGIDSQSNYKHH